MTAMALLAAAAVAAAGGFVQDWANSYEQGISLSRQGDWPRARQLFRQAASERRGDIQDATNLPGPITEPRVWRAGAPFSPNFASAYAGYRWALEQPDPDERRRTLQAAAVELEALLAANQHSAEAYFVMSQVLALLRDEEKPKALRQGFVKRGKFNWRVDTEFMTQEDRELAETTRGEFVALLSVKVQDPSPVQNVEPPPPGQGAQTGNQTGAQGAAEPPGQAAGNQTGGGAAAGGTDPATGPKPAEKPPLAQSENPARKPPRRPPPGADTGTGRRQETGTQNQAGSQAGPAGTVTDLKAQDLPNVQTSRPGEVAAVPTKFALLIGNAESAIPDARQPFALTDAQAVREGLVKNAGYAQENVELLSNATREQIQTAAETLAARMPEGATLFLFFSGVGSHIGGRDFLAGSDTANAFETSTMLPKTDLVRLFTAKGARVFSFYQVARPRVESASFGSEPPAGGSVAQMMGTLDGKQLTSVFEGGVERGLFSLGITKTLEMFRTNSVPIGEFGWQVFYAMRGGRNGLGSLQTPTLPVLTLLEQDSRF